MKEELQPDSQAIAPKRAQAGGAAAPETENAGKDLSSKGLAQEIANAAWDKKGRDVVALDVKELAGYTDILVIVSGNNERQVNAISAGVEDHLKKRHGVRPLGVEGRNEGRWVLLDYANVVVHVLQEPVRGFYDLERLWPDAQSVELDEPEWLNEVI